MLFRSRETVIDLGCGAGTDLLIAAQMVGSGGRAIGIDMTSSMVKRARESATEMGLANVEVHEGLIEQLPLADESVDVVISNGVIDLVPDKDAVFSEIRRVLRPGGRIQIADVVIHREVSEEAKRACMPRSFSRDRKSTRLNSSHPVLSRMPSSA